MRRRNSLRKNKFHAVKLLLSDLEQGKIFEKRVSTMSTLWQDRLSIIQVLEKTKCEVQQVQSTWT
jgi:hypothetical protein